MKIKYEYLEVNSSDFEGASGALRLKAAYRTAIAKAHDANSDTKLAEGTGDEVTAADLKAFMVSKGANSGLCPLNSSGKIADSYFSSTVIIDTYAVDDITERDALTVQKGDVAIVTDSGDGSSRSYIYSGTEWKELKSPTGGVGTVNGQSGTVVLDAGDIAVTAPSGWTAEDLQEAIDEAATKIANLSEWRTLTLGGTGGAALVGIDASGFTVLDTEDTVQEALATFDTEIAELQGRGDYVFEDPITIDSSILSAKKVSLSANPASVSKVFCFANAVLQTPTTDFVITNGNELSWNAKGMDGIVADGHILQIAFKK